MTRRSGRAGWLLWELQISLLFLYLRIARDLVASGITHQNAISKHIRCANGAMYIKLSFDIRLICFDEHVPKYIKMNFDVLADAGTVTSKNTSKTAYVGLVYMDAFW